jgi:hypothetical protein
VQFAAAGSCGAATQQTELDLSVARKARREIRPPGEPNVVSNVVDANVTDLRFDGERGLDVIISISTTLASTRSAISAMLGAVRLTHSCSTGGSRRLGMVSSSKNHQES